MKYRRNHWIVWTIVFALLCLLCACGGPASSGQDVYAPDEPGAGGENMFSPEMPGQAAGPVISGGDLIPLSRETGKGCYTKGEKDGHQLMCYVDYDLAQEVPLCAQPSCGHDSDACTAFVEQGKILCANPWTGDGSAIFFRMMDADGGDEIWTAGPDGSGRRLLVQRTSGSYVDLLVAEDGAFLYYFYTFEPDGEENGLLPEIEWRLARVPLQGGESEDLFAWEGYGAGTYYKFLGVSGREIAIYRSDCSDPAALMLVVPEDTPPEEVDAAIDAQRERQKQIINDECVVLFNVDTGAQRKLDAWSRNLGSPGRSFLMGNGRLYWCSDQTCGPIHWLDMDGHSGELFAMPAKSNDEDSTYELYRIVPGRLLADCYGFKTDTASRWAIDLSDDSADSGTAGGAEAMTLRYVHGVSDRPVRIEAQGEAGFLVQYDETAEYSTGFYEDDGTARSILTITRCYGLISYEDYFANRPNYRPVEMPYDFLPE